MSRLVISLGMVIYGCLFCMLSYSAPIFFQPNDQKILSNAPGLKDFVLDTALKAYHWAVSHQQVKNPSILSIVDFSLPADAKRLWVIDLRSSQVLMRLRTSQGRNSGLMMAHTFSNRPSSHMSSLGVYTTLDAYRGAHGLSLHLLGLESGINDNAYRRNIDVHPAWYVSEQFVKANKRTGRSFGCFALNPKKE